MRNLIRADLHRILRKPGFYVLFVLCLALILHKSPGDSSSDLMEIMRLMLGTLYLYCAIIPIFMSVYGDEIKSGLMISVIGRGFSRKKLIIAKLLDASILLFFSYAAAYICVWLKGMASGLAVTPKQNKMLLLYCIFCVLRGIGYFAVAAWAVFVSWNAAGGMFILIVASMMSKTFFEFVQGKLQLPIYDASYEGLLDASLADFTMGEFGWQIIPALGIYLLGVIIITVVLFNRKELDL